MATSEQFAVSPSEWPQLQAAASKALGIAIAGDTGQATEPTHGILVQWAYADGTLTLTEPNVGGIEGHFVSGHARSAVNSALATIRAAQQGATT